MLATKRPKTLTEIPSLHDHPRVKAAHDKLAHLAKRRDKIEIELEGMRGQSPRQRVKDEAAAMLAGKTAPTQEEMPVRADLMRTLDVIDEAERQQKATIESIKQEVRRELRDAITPRRQELLAQLDSGIESTVDALRQLIAFYDEAERNDLTPSWGIGTPWTSAAIELGAQQYVLERLEQWRAEFAADGFEVTV